MQYLEKLSLFIKKKIELTGLSLNKFSIEAEVDSGSLSKFENNKQKQLSISTLIKIAKAFNQTLAEFLTEFEKEFNDD